ncbi:MULTISPECIES: sigma factor-like helix-turn-helix DNA-binding protein [unclassified Polynucleobacter]|uniref:sigma factor-like helix-turn-helix DNA-binding protein n=1 Tax=unclassified Polynucleobacter TaxID=2640945 RepID=UPI00336561BA|nr:hypothetical protein PHIN10_14740 [Polynucleobacter sp. HIN10]BEI45101.1 hypothetical protein PHIN11_14730 [Polynucleobacter sp. HIN11]
MEHQIKPTSPSNGLTLKEVADVIGATCEQVRKIEAKALINLQKQLDLRNLKQINQII